MRDDGRRKVVLVVGAGRQGYETKSSEVGAWIAANDWHLLTGGGAGVMQAVSRSFREFQRHSLSIGIVPGSVATADGKKAYRTKNANYPNPVLDLAIMTHLPGEDPRGDLSRNHINVLSADLVIALPGGKGTAAEIDLAQEYGKPVIVFVTGEESIDGRKPAQLEANGFTVVSSFRNLVDASRVVLTPEADASRKSLRIPLSSCLLRLWMWEDVDSLQRHANNINVSRNLLDQFPSPYRRRDAERWLAVSQSTKTVFAIDVDGQAVGGIGFSTHDDSPSFVAVIGYWLGEEFWGRGIATEALCAVTSYAFAADEGLHRIIANVFPWNPASMRVLEKAGYTREGVLHHSAIKNGRFVDEVLFAKTRD
jgi:uncharacterized protein (TIGR00725 family)